MSEQIAFGIGCFHFGYSRSLPYTFTTAEYVKDLDAALKALPSVSDIKIDFDEGFERTLVVTEQVPKLSDGDFFPRVDFLEVKFSVFIPARVQAELFPNETEIPDTKTERFSVAISHKFHGPISYVECIKAGPECRPATAVRVLRHYLTREFKKLDSPVTFEYIGPSPFHANFYARQDTAQQESLTLHEIKQHGYNDLIFVYGNDVLPEDALDLIYYELSHELDCFYNIQRTSVSLMHDGYRLLSKWHELRRKTEANKSAWNLREKLQIHAEVQTLISDLYGFQANLAVELTQLRQDVASTYSKGTETYIESFVRAKLERVPEYPIESVLKWAEHIEGNSFKQAEIAAIVLSAFGGGVVGSLFTVLLQSGSR